MHHERRLLQDRDRSLEQRFRLAIPALTAVDLRLELSHDTFSRNTRLQLRQLLDAVRASQPITLAPVMVTATFAKARPAIVAVDHITLSVHRGEIFGVLGPNGTGKSTLIRLMSTLLLPDTGSVRIFGLDVEKDEAKV